ncbi:MAG: tetratricopeptide repeat protein [Deltaproteobacteria bacterium]|nr:tetratricopeptide repeat protein [Deltaproteobacteria bacterium]
MTKARIFLFVGFFLCAGIESQGQSMALAQSAQPGIDSLIELRSRAQTAAQAKHYEQATALYRQYLSLKPNDDEVRTALALVLAYSKQFAEATIVYKDILTRHPHDLDVQLALARVHAWQKQYAEARAIFEYVLRENPHYTEAKHSLADTLFWSGEDAAALPLY